MPKISNSPYLPRMPRLKQRTLSHCGPAVLSMLAGFIGYEIDQDKFVVAAKKSRKDLRHNGMDVDELAKSVIVLLPNVNFWVKQEASINDVTAITEKYKYPVGVEWQGVFGEWSNGDDGHYSVIVHVDKTADKLILIDPFWYYSGSDRIFSIEKFTSRWWDANQVIDQKTGHIIRVTDRQLMFVIADKSDAFPTTVGMEPYQSNKLVRYGSYT
jgi:hypothetical protein